MLYNPWTYAVIAAVLIITALSLYAANLLKSLKKQTLQQQQAKREQQQALKIHDKKVLDSLVIIVRAMKEDQCELAEGCWRIYVLLGSLKLSQDLISQFPAIFELYNAIKHMPILEKRKKLTKQERMKLDFDRLKAEAKLADNIKEDIILLHQYAIERISVLLK